MEFYLHKYKLIKIKLYIKYLIIINLPNKYQVYTIEVFQFFRGANELSKFLFDKYNIKISGSGICQSVAKGNKCRKILVEKLII